MATMEHYETPRRYFKPFMGFNHWKTWILCRYRRYPLFVCCAPKPCAAGNGDASRGLGLGRGWHVGKSNFQANLGSPNFQPWQPVEKTSPLVFSRGDLVKTFQTIYKPFWCKNDMKQCSNVKHVQKLCNYVYLYCILHSSRRTIRKHPWNFTHCLFWWLLCDVRFYLFFQGCSTGKNSTSKKQSLNSQPNLCHKLFEGRFLRELLPYWRGTLPNFQPPNREVAINSMKLHIPPLPVPAHQGWRPVARRDHGVKNISSVLNCWCKLVESNVTTIFLVGWFREWWY